MPSKAASDSRQKILGFRLPITPIEEKFKSADTVITLLIRLALFIAIVTALIYRLTGVKYIFGLPNSGIFQEHYAYDVIAPDKPNISFPLFKFVTGSVLWSIIAAISAYIFVKIRGQTRVHPSHYKTKIMGIPLKQWTIIITILAIATPVVGNTLAAPILSMPIPTPQAAVISMAALFMLIVYPSFVLAYSYSSLFQAFWYSLLFLLLLPIVLVMVIPKAVSILYKKLVAFITTGKNAKLKTGIIVTLVSVGLGIFLMYILSLADPVFAHYVDAILDLTVRLLRHILVTVWIFIINFFTSFLILLTFTLLYPELPFNIKYDQLQTHLKNLKQSIKSAPTPLSSITLVVFVIPLVILLMFNAIHTYHLATLKGTSILQRYGIINFPQFAIRGVIHLLIATSVILGLLILLYRYLFKAYRQLPKITSLILLGSSIAILWILGLSIYKINFAISYSGATVRRLAAYYVVSLSTFAIATALYLLYKRIKRSAPLIFRIDFINSLSIELVLMLILITFTVTITPLERINALMIQNKIMNSETSRGFVYMFNPTYFAFSPALVETYNQLYNESPNSVKTLLLYEYLNFQKELLHNIFLSGQEESIIKNPDILLTFKAGLKAAKFYKYTRHITAPPTTLVHRLQELSILPNTEFALKSCTYNSPYSPGRLLSALTLPDPNNYAPHPLALKQMPEEEDFRRKLATNEYIVCQFTTKQDQSKTSPYPQYDYPLEVYFFDQQDSKALQILVREYKNQSSNLPSYSSGRSVFYAE